LRGDWESKAGSAWALRRGREFCQQAKTCDRKRARVSLIARTSIFD